MKAIKKSLLTASIAVCLVMCLISVKSQETRNISYEKIPLKSSVAGDSVFYYKSQGDSICYRKWRCPNTIGHKKELLIIHGIGYQSFPYKKIMDYVDKNNILVYAIDLRGHGLSGKSKGELESNEKIMKDLDNLVNLIKRENTDSEIYMMGVSMGGIYALGYALNYQAETKLTGLILVGAALKTHKSQLIQFGNLLYLFPFLFNRHKPVVNLDKKRLEQSSDNQIFISSRRNDTLSIHKVSTDYLIKVHEMQKFCKRKSLLDDLSIPVLIQHGGKDRIIALKGSYYIDKNLKNCRTEMIVYPRSTHSLFWDSDSARVFKDIIDWIGDN